MASSAAEATELSTDEKLGILSSLFELHEVPYLLDMLIKHEGSVTRAIDGILGHDDTASTLHQKRKAPSALERLQWSGATVDEADTKRRRGLVLPALHVYTPEMVARVAPCTLVPNVFPAELADALLRAMLRESASWRRNTFRLFGRNVSSPHRICLYTQDPPGGNQAEFSYNGVWLETKRHFIPEMQEARDHVERVVNQVLDKRTRHHYEPKGRWTTNAAFSNLYDGPMESVGYHADQLTYLGPMPTIASISLGCEREFRIKRIQTTGLSPQDKRPIGIHLPHNSLLIMHAGMQEEWKHCLHPAQTLTPHPIATLARINITFRHYRKSFAPNHVPRCKCNAPAVLRTVVKGSQKNNGRYFWSCDTDKRVVPGATHESLSDGDEGCGYFAFARIDEHGELEHGNGK